MRETIATLATHARENSFALFLLAFGGTIAFGLFKLAAILQSL